MASIQTFGQKINLHARKEAERVGKYIMRPLLSLQRLSLDEREGKACYRYGKEATEVERMDYLEFLMDSETGTEYFS